VGLGISERLETRSSEKIARMEAADGSVANPAVGSVRVDAVCKPRPTLFKWRHFEPPIIVCAVRWYLRYSLSYRDVEELVTERGLAVDHTTILALGAAVRTGTQ
jgi:hypothetical protein